MSFENKGSIATTVYVTLEPDRSGNYWCTGANDDVEIQLAIDETGRRGGGEVFLGEGVYSISAALVDNGNNNVTVRGAGKYATKLDLQSAINGFDLTTCSGWTIRDLEIDGNDHQANAHYGINLNAVTDFSIEEVYIHNIAYTDDAAYGIYVYNSQRGQIERCKIIDCDHAGITLAYDTRDVDIVECYAEDNANGGAAQSAHYMIYGTSGHRVINCEVVGCTGIDSGNHGVQIYREAEHCYVRGGYYEDAAASCVGVGQSTEINTCENIGAIGVRMRMADNGVEVYNDNSLVEGCTMHGIVSNAIYVDDETEGSTIDGNNYFEDAATHGEFIHCDADYCTITGNVGEGYDENNGLSIHGSHNVATGNKIKDFDTGAWLGNGNQNHLENNVFISCVTAGVNVGGGTGNFVGKNEYENCGIFVTDAGTATQFETFQTSWGYYGGGASSIGDGITISATNHEMSFFFQLPLWVHSVLRIEIWAVSNVTEADGMRLYITCRGGADNEGKGTHTGDPGNETSATTNFAADDIIHWSETTAGIVALSGGDNISIYCTHTGASGADVETNADFRKAVLVVV